MKMNKLPRPDAQNFDEQLAVFTDLVLSQDEIVETMEEAEQQVELQKLQETVLRMKFATRQALPDVEIRERIRRNLLAEWQSGSRSASAGQKGASGLRKFPAISLAGGFALILLLGVLLVSLPDNAPLSAAAGDGSPGWMPFFIFAGAIVVAIVLWFRHKR
jgi:hypothetical protein